ncbi:MAG: 2-amino-4-hydroxy-6-hydroxymethyldihydropteridine diphosphokinase [Parachlamydia sp.]|nr:MAG: 2-amino-4-hydroxy-6-hydroxymethyldihydropteridine diphosphokinase [Parachlamydia sp.]
MKLKKAFIGLGGNIGDSYAILKQALKLIEELPQVFHLKASAFYSTTPVGPILQENFLNAVCSVQTSLSAHQLLYALQGIEKVLGKVEKPKNAPRVIDLDLLLFDTEKHASPHLEVPHPRWKERLFVLIPLTDLESELLVPAENGQNLIRLNLHRLVREFPNIHQETVLQVQEKMAI